MPNRCPEGHELPHHTSTGRCTPIYCAGEDTKRTKLTKARAPRRSAEADDERWEEDKTRAEVFAERMKVPDIADPEEAVTYSEKKLQTLAPTAVATQEWLMCHGSMEQRERASQFVLKAVGLANKEQPAPPAQVIVLTGMTNPTELPWAQRIPQLQNKESANEKK